MDTVINMESFCEFVVSVLHNYEHLLTIIVIVIVMHFSPGTIAVEIVNQERDSLIYIIGDKFFLCVLHAPSVTDSCIFS